MARLLSKLGSTAYRRWPIFISAWLLIAVVVGALAGTVAKPFNDEFSIPGIPSEKAAQIQKELFPESGDAFDDASVNVVLGAREGHTLDDATYAPAVADLVAQSKQLPQMSDDPDANPRLGNPVDIAKAQLDQYVDGARESGGDVAAARANAAAVSPVADDGRFGLMTFSWDVEKPTDVKQSSIDELDKILDDARDAGLVAEVNGQQFFKVRLGPVASTAEAGRIIGRRMFEAYQDFARSN